MTDAPERKRHAVRREGASHGQGEAGTVGGGTMSALKEPPADDVRVQLAAERTLLAGVTPVPSGAVEVLRKQHEGYAYFKP